MVDYISGERQIQSSNFHMYMNNHGLPIYDELMQESTMLPYQKNNGGNNAADFIFFSESDWQAVEAARSQINRAIFPTELDMAIDNLFYELSNATDNSQKDKLIDECYKKLQMLLGES